VISIVSKSGKKSLAALIVVVVSCVIFELLFILTASNMVHMKVVDEPTNYGSVKFYDVVNFFVNIT